MSLLTTVREGWTQALPFTLKADGVGVDLTGLSVSVILRDCHGNLVRDTNSTAFVLVSTSASTEGQVAYQPSSSGLDFIATKTPYRIAFRVTDALGRVVVFPNEDVDELIKVRPL